MRFLLSILCATLLFQAHPEVAASACVAVCAYAFARDRDRAAESTVAALVGFAAWAVWYASLPPIASRSESPLSLLFHDPGPWIRRTALGTLAGVRDLDYADCLPIAAWVAVLALATVRRRGAEVASSLRGAGALVLAAVVIQVLFAAAAVGVEKEDLAVLRYMPHVTVLAPLPLLLALGGVVSGARRALLLFAVVVATNLGTAGFWLPQATRRPMPLSWWPAVYGEIARPGPDDVLTIARGVLLRAQGASSPGPLTALPRYYDDIFLYYLGGRYQVVPNTDPSSECSTALERAVGSEEWSRMHGPPAAVVAFGRLPLSPPGYEAIYLPIQRRVPDGSRPELTRHDFPQGECVNVATVLFERQGASR